MFSSSHARMFAECVRTFACSHVRSSHVPRMCSHVLMFAQHIWGCSHVRMFSNHVLSLSKRILPVACSPIGTGTNPPESRPRRSGDRRAARLNWGRSPLLWNGPKTASAVTGPGFASHQTSPRVQLPGPPIFRAAFPDPKILSEFRYGSGVWVAPPQPRATLIYVPPSDVTLFRMWV